MTHIYIFGPNSNHTYDFPHSEVIVGLNAAKGFQTAGREVTVLWGGTDTLVEGVPHEHMTRGRPRPDDILLVMHPLLAVAVVNEERFVHLRVPNCKWLFTNSWYPGEGGRIAYMNEWEHFDPIFVEGSTSVPIIQQAFPHKKVCWLMIGCSRDVDLQGLSNPYPQGVKPIFLAGRLQNPSGRVKMLELLRHLPTGFEVWCASQYEPGNELLQDPRFHFMGALPFGSFWHYHHFAFASLDFGFYTHTQGINCKIIDALRAGGRVIADGFSTSHYLIGAYYAGGVVPFDDMETMCHVLAKWQPEERTLRLNRAQAFVREQSWDVRIRDLIRYIEGSKGMLG